MLKSVNNVYQGLLISCWPNTEVFTNFQTKLYASYSWPAIQLFKASILLCWKKICARSNSFSGWKIDDSQMDPSQVNIKKKEHYPAQSVNNIFMLLFPPLQRISVDDTTTIPKHIDVGFWTQNFLALQNQSWLLFFLRVTKNWNHQFADSFRSHCRRCGIRISDWKSMLWDCIEFCSDLYDVSAYTHRPLKK